MRSMTTNAAACFVGCVCFALVGDAFAAPPANLPPAAALQDDTGGDFIELTVGCCGEPVEVSILAGVQDNYDPSNGPELAWPSSEFLKLYQFCFDGQPEFDVLYQDRCFGHTFTDLPSCVIGAQMTIGLRTNVAGSYNDQIYLDLGGPLVFRWGIAIADLPGAGGTWEPGQTLVVTLDLANLPQGFIGPTNILIGLEDGNLDVYVQDDTWVDFITLDLIFCETGCLSDIIGDLNGDGSVGVADLLILFAFWGEVDVFPEADLDGDGFVGTSDLLILLANWGGPC